MRNRHGEGALLVAFMALNACADPANRIAGPTTSSADVQTGTAAQSEERIALSRIARLVAVAMDNEPARQHLKRDMRAAPFREHKLQLAPYLRSKDGKALLTRMVSANGGTEADVFKALNAIRPLEFYMPARQHREKWNGKTDVLVVSQLTEAEEIVAFDRTGRTVALDRSTPPSQATLALIPIETNFAAPLSSKTSRNARDENGEAIGTLEEGNIQVSNMVSTCDVACVPDGDGSPPPGDYGGGGAPAPGGGAAIEPGLYLEFSRILDAKEPWFRGDPEIEVHIHGPRDPRTPAYGSDLSCSGEHAGDYRKVFNQDGGFWEGRVMLFGADEVKAYANTFNDQGFHVFFWEDDNQPCELKLDSNALVQVLKATVATAATVAIKVLYTGPAWVMGALFFASVFENPGATLLTNDDFLGAAVDIRSTGYNYPGNSHVIMDGARLNGRANIVYYP